MTSYIEYARDIKLYQAKYDPKLYSGSDGKNYLNLNNYQLIYIDYLHIPGLFSFSTFLLILVNCFWLPYLLHAAKGMIQYRNADC